MREAQIRLKEKDRAALLDESSRIVLTANREGRELTPAEDEYVLTLLRRVRTLEDEIHELKKQRPTHG